MTAPWATATSREPAGNARRERLTADRRQTYLGLVRHATLAASSHNTQPWKFALEPGRIRILPDLSRRCPAVDPDDHHLYASLGCAAENMMVAARAAGLEGHLSFDVTDMSVTVDLDDAPVERSALFDAIPRRQCSRAAYDGSDLTAAELKALTAAARSDHASLVLLTAPTEKARIAEHVAAGNTAQFADPAWRRELKAWIRFDRREAERRGDGLYGPVMGSPDVPRWVGELFMRVGFSATRQNKKDVAHILSSSAIAVFVSNRDDPRHWVEAGRAYERVALQAAAMDLRSAFINQPVEVPSLRAELASFLGIGSRRADLVIRIGRGPEMPRSFRRPVEAVLV